MNNAKFLLSLKKKHKIQFIYRIIEKISLTLESNLINDNLS